MTERRPIAVSMVAFDGYPMATALDEIARAGASHVEPAFISGTMPFTEDDLSEDAAGVWRRAIAGAGLGCLAVSAHMDCGVPDAAQLLARRLRFAAAAGARYVITNTARRSRRESFLRTVSNIIPVTEAADVDLAFENPGHGPEDLLSRAADAAPLLQTIGSPRVGFNYDVGNALTCSEGGVRPEQDLAVALPLAWHLHLKDMVRQDGRWVYTALGGGAVDYTAVLPQIATRADLPICIELPLRQIRRVGAAPVRGETPPPLSHIRGTLAASVACVRRIASPVA